MATDSFRRHARARVDAATHRAFASLSRYSLFERLLRVGKPRDVACVRALRNFVDFGHELVRTPETWSGAAGHPLYVVDSLASHLFGRYPTPRFLASAWLAGPIDRRRWFVAHARGTRFRALDLPFVMTRRMEHAFLRTPDHIAIDRALRRAEVLGLGGSHELAGAIAATSLGQDFSNAERWRDVLAWLARCDDVELAHVPRLVEYVAANLNGFEVRGRTFASAMQLVRAWRREPFATWPRAAWNGLVHGVWIIVELADSRALFDEGRRMRHCVATYTRRCIARRSSIWSLRQRCADDGTTRSVLTIEVQPATRAIVQLKTYANGRPSQPQLELVRHWAAREGLRLA